MKRIPISLTDRQHERLRHEAVTRHVSVATLVRDAIERVYPDERAKRRAAHDLANTVIGTFHDDRHDVAERHDDYLGELERW